MLLNPFRPLTTAKVLALKATVLLLLTLLIKAKIRITGFSALGVFLLLLQTLVFLALGTGAGLWWQKNGWAISANYVAANGDIGAPSVGGIASSGSGGTGTVQLGYSSERWEMAAVYSRLQNANDLIVYGTNFSLKNFSNPGATNAAAGQGALKVVTEWGALQGLDPRASGSDRQQPNCPSQRILVCRASSCWKQGGREIYQRLQDSAAAIGDEDTISIETMGCMVR